MKNIFNRKFLGSVLFIAGTSIGAGMLALPVTTAPIGFYFSVILLISVWFFMCLTGLLVVEVNAWLPIGTSYISMAKQTLGKTGQVVTWLVFLLLLYSLLAAYTTGGGALVAAASRYYFHYQLQSWQSYLPWIVAFAVVISLGTKVSDMVNRIFMFGLIVTFAILASAVTPHIHMRQFLHDYHLHYLLIALPILFTSFGYHIVLPSVRNYLDSRTKLLCSAVIIGSLIPLCFYIFWEFLIFGVIPMKGPHGLLAILQSGQPSDLLTQSIIVLMQSNWVIFAIRFFIFFAIASSFIGVSMGLFDLLADGLKIKKTISGRGLLALLTFVPPLIYALIYPKGFIIALSYAGIFVAILHGILPAVMAWSGRYWLNLANGYRVYGGRFMLLAVIAISCLVIIYGCRF